MSFLDRILNSIKSRKEKSETKRIQAEENEFNNLSPEESNIHVNKIMAKSDKELLKYVEKNPHVLPHIMDKIHDREYLKLIDAATKRGVNFLDLLGKNENISDKVIVNIGATNQPNAIFGGLMKKEHKDMVSQETLVEIFLSNPAVVLSDCAELHTKTIKVKGVRKDGKEQTRTVTLKSQLLRAINLYMRPSAYNDRGFDKYAKSIADRINGTEFIKSLENLTSLLTTASNEVLNKRPEKAKSYSSSALHNWNNRVAHKLPKLAKSEIRTKALRDSKGKVAVEKWYKLLCGLLSNTALNSFSDKEKKSLVIDCVTVMPELYYDLSSLGLKDCAKELAVQLKTYETFKSLKNNEAAKELLEFIGEEQSKKVLSRSKSNATRKANKAKRDSGEGQNKVKEETFDRYKY